MSNAETNAPYFGSDPQGFQSQYELNEFLALIDAEIDRLAHEKAHNRKGDAGAQMTLAL